MKTPSKKPKNHINSQTFAIRSTFQTWKISLSDVLFNQQGERGDKGERGVTTTLNGEQFPAGAFEGQPGPPGPPGKLSLSLLFFPQKQGTHKRVQNIIQNSFSAGIQQKIPL